MKADQGISPSAAPGRSLWVALYALVLLGGFGLRDLRLGPDSTADDYAQYLLHARALVDGRPFAETGYIFSPLQWGVGPPVQSPGYPLTVAPFFAAFGEQPWIPGLLALLSAFAFVGLAGLYFRRFGDWVGSLVMLLTTVALLQIHAVGTPGPDLGFCALLWGVTLLADREDRWSWSRTGAICLLAVAAVLYRVAALPLVPALFAFGVLNWRRHGVRPLLAGAVAGGAFAWVFAVFGASRIPAPPEYVLDAVRAARASGQARPRPSFLARWTERASSYAPGVFELQLYPFPGKRLNQLYHVVIALPMAVGGLLWGVRQWRSFGVLFAAAYVSMLVLLPLGASRYLWPLAPVIAFGIIEGCRWVGSRSSVVRPRARGFGTALLVALSTLAVLRIPFEQRPRPITENPDVIAMFDAVRREGQGAPVRASFYKARTLVWATGVATAPLAGARTDETVLEEVAALGLTHIIVGSLDGEVDSSVGQWRRMVSERPEEFELVTRSGEFALYRVRRPPDVG